MNFAKPPPQTRDDVTISTAIFEQPKSTCDFSAYIEWHESWMNVWNIFTIKCRSKYINLTQSGRFPASYDVDDDDDDDEFTGGLINVGWFSHLKGRHDLRYRPVKGDSTTLMVYDSCYINHLLRVVPSTLTLL